jgi:hypothetical protein
MITIFSDFWQFLAKKSVVVKFLKKLAVGNLSKKRQLFKNHNIGA